MTELEIKELQRDLLETQKLMIRTRDMSYMQRSLMGAINTFSSKPEYDHLYTSATEDMRTYYKEFNNPKSFLSIGASGDQVANAINTGATVIDVYDSNHLCKYAVALRLAAIQALDKNELMMFFSTFDPYLFSKLAEYLDEKSLNYWGNLYLTLKEGNAGAALRGMLFTYKKLDDSLIYRMNPYLDDENYKSLKDKIAATKVTYYDCDLYSLPKVIGSKMYDAMTFSNIYEYINYGTNISRKKAKAYRDFVMDKMYPHLNPGGCIMVSYLYAFSDELKRDFDKMYQQNPSKVVPSGPITLDQMRYYMEGLTTQNLAYSQLLDAFKKDPLTKVPTEHIKYGQSKDMSHDLALCIKK